MSVSVRVITSPRLSAGGAGGWETGNSREALDQGKLVLDLAALGFGLVLCLVELLGRGVLLEGDLVPATSDSCRCLVYSSRSGSYVVERHVEGGRGANVSAWKCACVGCWAADGPKGMRLEKMACL